MKDISNRTDSTASRTVLDVVVVTYNSWASVKTELLEMLNISRRVAEVHWIFIDNSEAGEDAAALRKNLLGTERVTILESSSNVGFAAGCNLGVSKGSAEWVCFINPDIAITESHIKEILKHLNTGKAADTIALGQVTRGFAHTGVGATRYMWFTDRPTGSRMKLLGPSGGAGVYRRSVYTAHGGFYEPLFAWGEDADLAMRLARAGIRCDPLELGLSHQGQHSVSSGKKSRSFKARLLTRNRFWVAQRNFPPLHLTAFIFIHASIVALLSVRNIRRGTVAASWLGFVDGLRIILNKKEFGN